MGKDESHSAAAIAEVWISYHLWATTRPRRDNLSREEHREADAEADRHGFWAYEPGRKPSARFCSRAEGE